MRHEGPFLKRRSVKYRLPSLPALRYIANLRGTTHQVSGIVMHNTEIHEDQEHKEKDEKRIDQLRTSVTRRAPLDAVVLLNRESDELVGDVLERLDPTLAMRILSHMDPKRGELLRTHICDQVGEQWSVNLHYDEESVGSLMEPAIEAYP